MQPYFAGVPFHAAPTSRQAVAYHSPLCVSLVYQDIEPTNSAQTILHSDRVLLRLQSLRRPSRHSAPPTLLRYAAASAGAVVATVPASVDADCDNGTVLHNSARFRKRNERANGRTDTG